MAVAFCNPSPVIHFVARTRLGESEKDGGRVGGWGSPLILLGIYERGEKRKRTGEQEEGRECDAAGLVLWTALSAYDENCASENFFRRVLSLLSRCYANNEQ